MYPKVEVLSSQQVVKKVVHYTSDLYCEYTLADNVLTAFSFFSKQYGLFDILLDKETLQKVLRMGRKEVVNNVCSLSKKENFTKEVELLSFNSTAFLFQIKDGALLGTNGQYYIFPADLQQSYLHSYFQITTKEEMLDFISFIRKHPDIEVLEDLAYDYVPYYNQNEEGTLLTLTEGLVKVSGEVKTASLQKSSSKKNSYYFSYTSLMNYLYKIFTNT